MYQSKCYNYEWFVEWLKRNLKAPEKTDYNTSASHIAKNFSRLHFEVTETNVVEALKSLGFEHQHTENGFIFSIDRSSPAFLEFQKTYN